MDLYALAHFMWIALIVVASILLVSAVDEFYFDAAYLYYRITRSRKLKKNHYKPLTYEILSAEPEQRIAVMIPCWHEELVIGEMLKHNMPIIDYKNYDVFVVGYPNDEKTISVVTDLEAQFNNLHCVVNSRPGPTTKADNLNEAYKYILQYEKENNIHYEIFVFHDAEDIIHPLSFKMYNHLIPKKDMVQIPIFPLEVANYLWTHWTYADEFAENHTKVMIIREFIQGLVPSAGVGMGLSRKALELLANEQRGLPFNLFSLTEDYSMSLQIHNLKLKSIFLTQTMDQVVAEKKWFFWGRIEPKIVKVLVATKALFPKKYLNAVHQRSRWVTGIALQEWFHSGWKGNLATRYTLFHDRKALISHFINVAGYIVFIFWIVYSLLDYDPSLSFFLSQNPSVWYLILACTILMLIRLAQRMHSTYVIYGIWPAVLSIPRIVYSNLLNFHSILLAYKNFFFQRKKLGWDKTRNAFPTTEELALYKKRLGDLLVEKKLITPEQLISSLKHQAISHEKLGDILLRETSINSNDILETIAKQYDLEVINLRLFKPLAKHEFSPNLSQSTYDWLLKNHCIPISYFNDEVKIAITDPANKDLIDKIVKMLEPLKVRFALSDDAVKYK